MTRSKSILPGVLAVLVTVTTASADLVTPPAYPGAAHVVTCKLVNISKADANAEIQLIDAVSAVVLATTGSIKVAPGRIAQNFLVHPVAQVYCRFVGATTMTARAAMTIYNPATPDSSDEVVVPAT